MKPGCNHPNAVKVYDAAWAYGNPGVTPARYRCPDCGVTWNKNEPPPSPIDHWAYSRPVGNGDQ